MTTIVQTAPVDAGLVSVDSIRGHFPALARRHVGKVVAYFDGPGGTQVPRPVVDAMGDYLCHHNANTHWAYPTSVETDAAINHSREAFADFFNCSPREVAFGNNMTTITFHTSRALGRKWGPGDELVWPELERAVTNKTQLVAIGAASNALGTISDVRRAAQLAHDKGALCYVDAVHFAAHCVIDVKEMECDFLACSPYKFYGPHAGVLFARSDVMSALDVAKVEPASNEIPERVETGTQNHEGIVGAGAAVEFLVSLASGGTRRERLVGAMSGLHSRGEVLFERLWSGLNSINGVRCYGPPPGRPRTPTVSFTVAGVASTDVARRLVGDGIFVSNGNFYATTVMERLGHSQTGVVRAGCACYTSDEEVERLVDGIRRIAGGKNVVG